MGKSWSVDYRWVNICRTRGNHDTIWPHTVALLADRTDSEVWPLCPVLRPADEWIWKRCSGTKLLQYKYIHILNNWRISILEKGLTISTGIMADISVLYRNIHRVLELRIKQSPRMELFLKDTQPKRHWAGKPPAFWYGQGTFTHLDYQAETRVGLSSPIWRKEAYCDLL